MLRSNTVIRIAYEWFNIRKHRGMHVPPISATAISVFNANLRRKS